MNKEQKNLLKELLASANRDCKEKIDEINKHDYWSNGVLELKRKIELIEKTYIEVDKM